MADGLVGLSTRQADTYTPPRSLLIANLAVSTSAGSQDLSAIDNQTVNLSKANATQIGIVGCYVDFFADGTDVGVVFGSTSASVTTTNAPVFATTGVNTAGVCWRIPAGAKATWYLQAGVDLFVGFVGAGSGFLRIARSSPFPKAV
jgi:hypothetical protein